MTLSLLLNNGRLALAASGKLPKSSSCCCDNPPPPLCTCFNACVYGIAVVSPTALRVGPALSSCGEGGNPPDLTWSLLDKVVGFLPTPPYFAGGDLSDSYGTARTAGNALLTAAVGHGSKGFAGISTTTFPPFPKYIECEIYSNAVIKVYCSPTANGDDNVASAYVAYVEFSVQVATYVNIGSAAGLSTDRQTYVYSRTGWVDVPSSCVKRPLARCPPSNDPFQLINTPLTVTLDKDTTSLGPYQTLTETTGGSPTYGDRAREIGEYMRDYLSMAAVITARENCDLECVVCCKDDGTISTYTDPEEECDGVLAVGTNEACDWTGVTLTITVNGISGTASVDDWINGLEPDFVGLGQGNLPDGKYLDTTGLKSCSCNFRSIGLHLNYSSSCFLTLTINDCTDTAIVTVDQTIPCTDEPAISAEVNWAP